ncbi:MAG TPA: hypothetical protein VGL72_12780 [Bryobacteraceae bacterium]|jgi:hypothetical protein
MKRLPLLVSLRVTPVFARVDNGTMQGAVRDTSGPAVALAETQINNRFDILTGTRAGIVLSVRRRLHVDGRVEGGACRNQVVGTSAAVAALGCKLKTEFRVKD